RDRLRLAHAGADDSRAPPPEARAALHLPPAMHALAVWTSRIFHPFVVPVPTLLVALRLLGVGWREALGWTALCVAVAIGPPTALLVAQRIRRGDGDWYVTV